MLLFGILEVVYVMGLGFINIVVLNFLFKWLNFVGLCCGFVVGDLDFLSKWVKFCGFVVL